MGELNPSQQRIRSRVESLIALMEPALNAVLGAGERLSRLVEREDHGYYPPRPLEQTPVTTNQRTSDQTSDQGKKKAEADPKP